jgi:DNA-binding FadR family transcriptional regulator
VSSDLIELNLAAVLDGGPDALLAPRPATKNVGEQLAERLVTAVALGVYVPGQRLPSERELSELVGVSRTGVREAIHLLADAGYVEVRRGRQGGAFVRADWGPESHEMIRRYLLPNWERFQALLDARLHVEGTIARLAAERRTKRDITRMREAQRDYTGAADRDASRVADQQLHLAVVEATGNPVLTSLSMQIRSRVSLGLGAEPYTSKVRAQAAIQHEELVDAIAAGDGDRASQLAQAHFQLTERLLRRLVRRISKELDA